LNIDPDGRVVTLDAEQLALTPKEFDLLLYLAERPGRVVARKELLAEVWRMPYGGADRTVDVHLSELRKKLGESAASPRFIHTVHGVGVRFVDPEPWGDRSTGWSSPSPDWWWSPLSSPSVCSYAGRLWSEPR